MGAHKLSARALAAQRLTLVLADGKSLTEALSSMPAHLSPADSALVRELCFGTCRFGHAIAAIANQLLQKPIKAKEKVVTSLLYLGLYQLMHTRIPDHAAISATVEASRELGKPWAAGLLNAVLRNYLRKHQNAPPWQGTPAVVYSHPEWLLKRLQKAWPEQWQAIAEGNNTHPPMTLRVNAAKTGRDSYLKQLAEAGIAASACRYSGHGIQLEHACNVEALPGFVEGLVSVQDEAAQLCAELLAPQMGMNILDACAAPGGKTCHLLETAPGLHMTAVELEQPRLERVQQNLARLNLEAQLICADAGNTDAWWNGEPFDRVLLDAPCSATGVIRRHPDIKWLRRNSDVDKLAALQQSLLQALWPTLKPGGLLLYATCSVLPQENSRQIEAFLRANGNAVELPIKAHWGHPQTAGRQLLPTPGGSDGFYYALLQKQPG